MSKALLSVVVSTGVVCLAGSSVSAQPCETPGDGGPCCGMYGDVNSDDSVDLLDIFCVLDGFRGVYDRCTFAAMDHWPCEGDDVIDLGDIISVLDAFSGNDKCCGATCGGLAGIPCDDDAFCKMRIGTCEVSDDFGVCRPLTPVCPEVYNPVCGCDGATYDNECKSDAAGVSVAHRGACGGVCGGIVGVPCNNVGQFCKFNVGECCCDYQGICTDRPEVCPDNWDPVCGCDGVTYSNLCGAEAAGVSVDRLGECG